MDLYRAHAKYASDRCIRHSERPIARLQAEPQDAQSNGLRISELAGSQIQSRSRGLKDATKPRPMASRLRSKLCHSIALECYIIFLFLQETLDWRTRWRADEYYETSRSRASLNHYLQSRVSSIDFGMTNEIRGRKQPAELRAKRAAATLHRTLLGDMYAKLADRMLLRNFPRFSEILTEFEFEPESESESEFQNQLAAATTFQRSSLSVAHLSQSSLATSKCISGRHYHYHYTTLLLI